MEKKFDNKINQYSIVIISIVNRSQYCEENSINSFQNALMNNIQLVCKFNYYSIKSNAKINCLPEHHDYNYTAALITCPLIKSIDQNELFETVSIEFIDSENTQIIASSDSLPIQFPVKECTFQLFIYFFDNLIKIQL